MLLVLKEHSEQKLSRAYRVEIVDLDKLFAELNSPDGVSHLVERWRPEANPHHVRYDQHQRPTHAGLGGQTDLNKILIKCCS